MGKHRLVHAHKPQSEGKKKVLPERVKYPRPGHKNRNIARPPGWRKVGIRRKRGTPDEEKKRQPQKQVEFPTNISTIGEKPKKGNPTREQKGKGVVVSATNKGVWQPRRGVGSKGKHRTKRRATNEKVFAKNLGGGGKNRETCAVVIFFLGWPGGGGLCRAMVIQGREDENCTNQRTPQGQWRTSERKKAKRRKEERVVKRYLLMRHIVPFTLGATVRHSKMEKDELGREREGHYFMGEEGKNEVPSSIQLLGKKRGGGRQLDPLPGKKVLSTLRKENGAWWCQML